METEESINNAVIKYANAVADTIFKYNLDGLDIDADQLRTALPNHTRDVAR